MLPKGIDALTFSDVAAVVEVGLRESRTLDFKQAPVGGRDDDKREFLADVSALANTAGGDIVFGITEAQGEATGVPGIELTDPDAEVLRLEAILRSGLEPRLPRVDLRWLPGPSGNGLLILRTPRSYLAPHRVTFRGHGHFYGRTDAGKTSLDVTELRAAFLATEGLHQGIRRFRNERLGIIEAGEGPIGLRPGANAVLHVLPLEAFVAEKDIGIDRHRDRLLPLGCTDGTGARHTIDGFASFAGETGGPEGTDDYVLLFRSGSIESVAAVSHYHNNAWSLRASDVEYSVLSALCNYRRKLAEKGIVPPIYVFLSFIGLRDHHLSGPPYSTRRPYNLRTDALLLPEAVITDAQQSDEDVLRPIMDRLWNAFGFEQSSSFDAVARLMRERS